jgi:hypothetical protein
LSTPKPPPFRLFWCRSTSAGVFTATSTVSDLITFCPIPGNIVAEHIAGNCSAGKEGENTHSSPGARNPQPIACGLIARKRIVVHAGRRSAKSRGVRSQHESAVVRVVLRDISGERIIVRGARIVAEQNPSRIVLHQVVCNGGMIHPAQMDGLAAVESLGRLPRRYSRTRGSGWDEAFVVACDNIPLDRDEGSVGCQNSLEVGVLDGEPRDHHVAQPWIVESIDVNAV